MTTAPDHLFREAAFERAARPRREAPTAEIPRPPTRTSLCALAGLLVAAAATALYIRVPEYASGSLIVGPADRLIVAVPVTAKRELRAGRPVVMASPSGDVVVRSTLTRVVGVVSRRWLDERVRLDPASRPAFGDALIVAYARRPRSRSAAARLGAAGTVLPARVEIARDSVFSHLPLVGRLG